MVSERRYASGLPALCLFKYETNANLRLNYWAASTIITSSWVEELDWDNLVDESTGCRKRRA